MFNFAFVFNSILFFSVTTSLLAQSEMQPEDPAELLMNTFQNRCESQGRFTAQALQEARGVETIIQRLKDDRACQGLRPLLTNIAEVSDSLQILDRGFSSEEAARPYRREAEKIAIMLATVSDESLKNSLGSLYVQNITEALKVDGEFAREQTKARAESIRNLSLYMTGLSDALQNLQLCFQTQPDLGFQMLGQLMTLSSGFFGPVARTALDLGGRMFVEMLQYMRNRNFVESLRRYRDEKMVTAMTCAAESLERTICDYQDYNSIIRTYLGYQSQVEIPKEWTGYELLVRDFPRVVEFLNFVISGTPARSSSQASRRTDFRTKDTAFKNIIEQASGAIGDTEKLLADLTAQHAQPSELKQEIDNLVIKLTMILFGRFSPSAGDNVFEQVTPNGDSTRLQIWLRIGNPNPPVVIDPNSPSDPYAIYLQQLQLLELKMMDLRKNLDSIIAVARGRLKAERSRIMNPDQQGTLARWTQRGATENDVGTVMERIETYLTHLQEDWEAHPEWFRDEVYRATQGALAANTQMRFIEALKTLRSSDPIPPSTQPASDSERLGKLYELFVLDEDDQFVTDRLRQIVQIDLELRLRHGLLADQPQLDTVIRLANMDLVFSVFPQDINRLGDVQDDLNEALGLAQSNLAQFYNFFRESIIKSFEIAWENSVLWKEGPEGLHRKRISKLCVLSLNAPQLESKEFEPVRKWCAEHGLSTKVLDKIYSVDFKKVLGEGAGNPNKRLCSYRRYMNDVELARRLLRKPSRYDTDFRNP